MEQIEAGQAVPTEPQPLRVTAEALETLVPLEFDWHVYADATAAGLAVLVPIPFLDWFLEQYFRRRMTGVIARLNGRRLTPAIRRAVNRSSGNFWSGCLMWPVQLALFILKNIYRNLIFILSVKDATDNLSYYWYRAFLIDYMARRGDLDSLERAQIGGRALNQVLSGITTSPLTGLAQQIVQRTHVTVRQALRVLFRWRRGKEEPAAVVQSRKELAARWSSLRDYLATVAQRYDEAYAAVEAAERQRSV